MQKRRLYAALATATLALGAGAAGVATAGTAGASTQLDISLNGVPTDVGPALCGIPDDVIITGNGHIHMDASGHVTGTVTGPATDGTSNPVTGVITSVGPWVGRATAWFGVSGQGAAPVQGTVVTHDILEYNLTNTVTGQQIKGNQEEQGTINLATGVTTFSHAFANCH